MQEELKIKLKIALKEKNDLCSGGQEPEDAVRLGEEGWKMRYYSTKFGVMNEADMEVVRADVVSGRGDGRGMRWVRGVLNACNALETFYCFPKCSIWQQEARSMKCSSTTR